MLLDYDEITKALVAVDAPLGAAELHAQLCGQLVMDPETDLYGWVAPYLEALEQAGGDEAIDIAPMERLLREVGDITHQQIVSNEYELRLLLPDDEVDLSQRVEALGLWCQGFLSGLGLAGLQVDDLNEEVAEILSDLSDISKAICEGENEEADEFAYAELVEYVRMAVYALRDR